MGPAKQRRNPILPHLLAQEGVWDPGKGQLGEIFQHPLGSLRSPAGWGRGGNLNSSGCSLQKVGGVASSSPQPHLRVHHHLHRQLLQKRTHPTLIQKRGQKLPLMQ